MGTLRDLFYVFIDQPATKMTCKPLQTKIDKALTAHFLAIDHLQLPNAKANHPTLQSTKVARKSLLLLRQRQTTLCAKDQPPGTSDSS